MVKARAQRDAPPPQLVLYNGWKQVAVPDLEAFVPELPVSVIVSHYAQPEELARTLAALEVQTYPQELFEVVVVDDGSPEPLARPPSTPLDVKVVRQEDLGFGLARARNTGARAATHDVLVFLDGDLLPEADWLAAHARRHHAVPDAMTLGLWAHVLVDGLDADTIRNRPGTLKELFAGRKMNFTTLKWFEYHLIRTNNLTSKADDPFRPTGGGNCGIRRRFYELAGKFDESFAQTSRSRNGAGRTRSSPTEPTRGSDCWCRRGTRSFGTKVPTRRAGRRRNKAGSCSLRSRAT